MSLAAPIALAVLMSVTTAHAASSIIVDADGSACAGGGISRQQAEADALVDLKRKAVERARAAMKGVASGSELEQLWPVSNVRVVREYESWWYRDSVSGECYRVKAQAEAVPDAKLLDRLSLSYEGTASRLLTVDLRAGKPSYAAGERLTFTFKGNKPFFARIIYRDAAGGLVQLLPSLYRTETSFEGGVTYEIPGGTDQFELTVSPPFGTETVTIYASSVPLGDVELSQTGPLSIVRSDQSEVASSSRMVKIEKKEGSASPPAEFFEMTTTITTHE